jgi:hypothetical protein
VVLHVPLIPEELVVRRVAYRVRAGGHPVAENTIRERYHRLWALVADAIMQCEQAAIYVNSSIKGPRIVAQMTDGFHRRLPRLARLDATVFDCWLADDMNTPATNRDRAAGWSAKPIISSPVRRRTAFGLWLAGDGNGIDPACTARLIARCSCYWVPSS